MTFAPGDSVHVAALGTGIVREVRNGGRYLVEIKGRSLVVFGRQLTPSATPPKTRRPAPPSTDAQVSGSDRTTASMTLDLHGTTVDECLDALGRFLNRALLAGHAEVRIIHGRSGGKLKAAVHAQLKRMSPVRDFGLDPSNPGVTIVRL